MKNKLQKALKAFKVNQQLKRTLVISFLFITTFNICNAQKSKVGNWLMYYGNHAIGKRWNWWTEAQLRNYNLIGDLQQLLLRTGIGYNLSENNNNLLVGYAYVNSQDYVSSDTKVGSDEHRLYQQFLTRQNFDRLIVQHRYRVEERFIPDNMKFRFRYQLSFILPITDKTLDKGTLYASAYDEVFIHAESPRFDRNRLYGALGFVIKRNLRLELGYMRQTLENSYRNQFQVAVFHNL